ncbi:MAG: hypothetical protein ORN98_01715 [Alphaproteobacteria bacterium]|nr:hypothetical protein [Alphaproteobacteria bacterium]
MMAQPTVASPSVSGRKTPRRKRPGLHVWRVICMFWLMARYDVLSPIGRGLGWSRYRILLLQLVRKSAVFHRNLAKDGRCWPRFSAPVLSNSGKAWQPAPI